MCPQPPGLVPWRRAVPAPEVEEDIRGLRDQHVAIFQKWRGKGRMLGRGSVHQALHRRDAAGAARDIDVFCARFLQCEAHEFTAPLDEAGAEYIDIARR